MIVLYIIVFILLIIVCMPLKVYFHMERNHIDVNLYLYKFIKIELSRKTKDKTQINTYNRFKAIPFDVLKKIYRDTKPNTKYIMKRTKVGLKINFNFGLSAPDKTAITYGLINSLLYSVDNLLRMNLKELNREYAIVPDMKNKKLAYQVKIEVYTWVIYLIVYGLKMLPILFKYKSYLMKKGGDNNVGASNTRTNENYNG